MAKKTKSSNPTIDERLEQALISEENEPYKLPDNWCWVRLGSINNYAGCSVDPAKAPSDIFELYSVPSSADDYPEIVAGDEIGSTKQAVEKEDVLLCKINPRINRVWKVAKHTEYALLASSEWIIIRNKGIVSDYLMWCLRSPYFREFMLSNVSGIGGSLMRAQPKHVQNYPIPLPPTSEQMRIVEKLESLFAKLDEAKEKAQEVVDGFETRKSAILHKAFSGELTEKWRTEQGLSDLWKTQKLSDVAHLQTGLMKGKKYDGDTVFMPYLRVANVQDGYLDLNEIKTIKVATANYERYLLRKGDVLFTEGGDYDKLGRGTVWNDEIPNCLHQNHIFVVRVDTNCLMPAFLSYQAGSQYGKKYFMSCAKQTTNLASINSTQLKNFPVMIPTIDEQQEIVRILDSVLVKEKQAKEAAEAVLEQIDRQKSAILSLACRGELGTNDPAEESAVELLKRII